MEWLAGSYVEMWEFKNTEEMEKVTTRKMKHGEMKELTQNSKKR